MDVIAEDSASTSRLPAEITIAVLMDADLRSLLRCRRVCRRWNSLIQDTVELQYRIELDLHQVEDNCPSDMTILDRLQLLRCTQRSWRKLDLERPIPIAMTNATHAQKFAFSGELIAYPDLAEQSIILKKIRPNTPEAEQLVWSQSHSIDLLGPILAMDVKQNLILVADILYERAQSEARVLLWSLGTGEVHTLAGNDGTLTAPVDNSSSSRLSARNIHVAGAFISMSIPYFPKDSDSMTQLLVWNWHTGALQMHLRSPRTSMIILDQKYIITRGSKALTTGVEATQGLAVLDLGNLSPDPTWITAETCDCLLLLPDSLVTEKNTIFIHMPDPQHRPSSVFPLTLDADRLIVVDFEGSSRLTVRALIIYSKLLNKIRASRDSAIPNHVIPWIEWQDCVVWMSDVLGPLRHFRPLQCVAGMRYLESPRPEFISGEDRSPAVRVMDFNPGRVARVSMSISPLGSRESLEQCCIFAEDEDDQELVFRYPHLSRELSGLRPLPRTHYSADNLLFEDGLYTFDQAFDGTTALVRISAVPFRKEQAQEEKRPDKQDSRLRARIARFGTH